MLRISNKNVQDLNYILTMIPLSPLFNTDVMYARRLFDFW